MTLEELTIRPEPDLARRLMAAWDWRIPQDYSVLFLSLFGDWFLTDDNGFVYLFDLVSSEIKQIADSETELMVLLEEAENRKEWLMEHAVAALKEAETPLGEGQCYAFRTPPMLGGTMSVDNVVAWDLEAYQTGTSKLHRQVTDLHPGTQVKIR